MLVNISKPKTDPNLLSLLSDCMGNYTKNLGSWKNIKYKNTTNFVSIEDKNSPVFFVKDGKSRICISIGNMFHAQADTSKLNVGYVLVQTGRQAKKALYLFILMYTYCYAFS